MQKICIYVYLQMQFNKENMSFEDSWQLDPNVRLSLVKIKLLVDQGKYFILDTLTKNDFPHHVSNKKEF